MERSFLEIVTFPADLCAGVVYKRKMVRGGDSNPEPLLNRDFKAGTNNFIDYMGSVAKPVGLEVAQTLVRIRDEIDEILETLEITNDEELMRGIREGLKQAKRGEGVPIDQLLRKLEKSG